MCSYMYMLLPKSSLSTHIKLVTSSSKFFWILFLLECSPLSFMAVATVAECADACLVLLTTGTPLVCIAVVHLYGTVQGVIYHGVVYEALKVVYEVLEVVYEVPQVYMPNILTCASMG